MFKYIFLTIFLIFSSCSNNDDFSEVKLGINPLTPIVFTADTVEVKKTIIDGVESIENINIPGPWMDIGVDFINKGKVAVTIIAATFYIDLPNGEERVQPIFNYGADGGALEFFTILRPENDVNCDGIVSEEEEKLTNPVLDTNCFMDETNPSFKNTRFKLFDLLNGAEDKNIHRGASYPVKARFEGWIGTFDSPEKNFFKEVFFIGQNSF